MHYLTPNAIIQLSKFYWTVRTFGAPVSPDTFYRFYELHPQGRKISFEGEDEIYSIERLLYLCSEEKQQGFEAGSC
jgi:hypothetical protein